jgi:DNA-binding NarL/FixJ family response regulator
MTVDGHALRRLSPRERELLALMAEGLTNAAIARRLHLSRKTVESHVRSIFRKLAARESPDHDPRVLSVLTYLAEHR